MKAKYVWTTVLVLFIFIVSSITGSCINLYNQEISLRKQIEAKQADNMSEFDNMWKKIKQTSNVADKYKDGFKEVVMAYVEGRSIENDGLMFKWANEAIPNFSEDLYLQIDNIITSSRDRFTEQQRILLDLKREHDVLITRFPNVIFFKFIGIKDLKIQTITSSKTEKAFETGKDNSVEL